MTVKERPYNLGVVLKPCLLLLAAAIAAEAHDIITTSITFTRDISRIVNNHCASCHASKRQVFGPSLNGVVGRPAGSVAGFPYTDALKKSGIVWTEDNLLKWLAGPAAMVPNAIMPHVAFSDPAERLYVVEYLKTLKAR